MIKPKSLSGWLRKEAKIRDNNSDCFYYDEQITAKIREAADALDAKDELIKRQSAEIGRLVAVTLHCGAQEAEVERLNRLLISEGANRYWEARWRDAAAEIELMKEGRTLHDEHADHLEHELAAQSALLAQAAAALEPFAQLGDNFKEKPVAVIAKCREALAAIRANEREYDKGVAPCDDAEFGMPP